MTETQIFIQDFKGILSVIPSTFGIAITIFFFSTFFGILIALIDQYRVPVLEQIIFIIKAFLKGTPMVIYIYITYFAFPLIIKSLINLFGISYNVQKISPTIIIIIALTCTLAPFQSEIIRGAFLSIPYNQIETAYSLGYSFFQTFVKIIIPQAFVVAIPDFINSILVILKALSLAFIISVVDIFAKAQLLAAINFHYIEAFTVAALSYWCISLVLTKFSSFYEISVRKKLKKKG